MHKRLFFVFLALACLLMPACSGRSVSESSDISASDSSVGEAQLLENSILTKLLAAAPDDVASFSYNGNAPYSFGGEHGLWAKDGYSATVFFCPNNYRKSRGYLNQENALVKQFAGALGSFPVNADFVEDMTADTVLPESDYISMDLVMRGERCPSLTIFECGDIYLTLNEGGDVPSRHYKAADATAYGTLKGAIADIRTALDALPLDYQLEMGVFPDRFKPESTALRLSFDNIGAQQVAFSRDFVVEKQKNGVWRRLSKKELVAATTEMLAVEPRSTGYYAIDLTNLEGGQEPGQYRVTNMFYTGEEQVTLTTKYEISDNALDISLPYKPDMTPENQMYYDKYLSAWGFYCPFEKKLHGAKLCSGFSPLSALLFQCRSRGQTGGI